MSALLLWETHSLHWRYRSAYSTVPVFYSVFSRQSARIQSVCWAQHSRHPFYTSNRDFPYMINMTQLCLHSYDKVLLSNFSCLNEFRVTNCPFHLKISIYSSWVIFQMWNKTNLGNDQISRGTVRRWQERAMQTEAQSSHCREENSPDPIKQLLYPSDLTSQL